VIPWQEKTRCLPPKADAEFVARMEDLLEVYQLPYDPRFPVVGMDEMPKQLIAATRIPLPVCEGHPMLYDYEDERTGVCHLFLFVEPLRGWRKVFVRDRRTKVDWAECVAGDPGSDLSPGDLCAIGAGQLEHAYDRLAV
jgi:hypothetical protein